MEKPESVSVSYEPCHKSILLTDLNCLAGHGRILRDGNIHLGSIFDLGL